MNQDENQPRYCFGDERMVRKPRSSDWSQNDTDRLCALAKAGKTPDQIARAIGRSALAVERRGKRLGLWQKRHDFWLDSEITKLRELAPTHTYEFLKTGEANPTAIYSAADIQRVFDLRAKAMTLKEIAAEIGMHFSYVADILNYEVRYRESLALDECAAEGK